MVTPSLSSSAFESLSDNSVDRDPTLFGKGERGRYRVGSMAERERASEREVTLPSIIIG